MHYTFQQPVRGGFYYMVVKAENEEEASDKAHQVASPFEHTTGRLVSLSHFPEGALVLNAGMQNRLNQFGITHDFTSTAHPPYHVRKGHYGFLPK